MHGQALPEYLLITIAVLVVAGFAVYFLSSGPSFPVISARGGVDATKDNIVIVVDSGRIEAGDWEYSLKQTTPGAYEWRAGDVPLSVGTIHLENKSSTPGAWYVSLRHKTSQYIYFRDQAVTVE